MKVSLGFNLQQGPWGGGNQFGHALTTYLQQRGVSVTHNLAQPDLDIILLTEPRISSKSSAYNDSHIIRYLLSRNKQALVIHRINECDERKGTNRVNKTLIQANQIADYTVFVATWLHDLLRAQGLPNKPYRTILNGADTVIFNPQGYQPWGGNGLLKLVTHHWGGHWLKGFDIYQRLDALMVTPPYQERLQFTYIGNLPTGFRFKHATYLPPKSGLELAQTIRQHHVYVTASQFEPGGNHQNEGALCGLPLLYRDSGCMPEYCDGFGISFTAENFEIKLQEMLHTYHNWVDRMPNYPHTAERMCEQYYQLFIELMDNRETFLSQRSWLHQPSIIYRALIPNSLIKLWYKVYYWLR